MTEESSFFSRFCCCSNYSKEQPPVQLITANSVPQQTHVISKAEETVDGFEDINLAEIKAENKLAAKEVEKNGKKVDKEEDFCMNDIMMNEIMENETLSNQEPIIEDAISIESNVIEEAREEEFQDYSKGETSGASSPSSSSEKEAESDRKGAESADVTKEIKEETKDEKKEFLKAELAREEAELAKQKEAESVDQGAESEDDEVIEMTGRSDEVVTFEQMMQEGYESTPNTARDSIMSDVPDAKEETVLAVLSARDSDESDTDSEDEEGEVIIETTQNAAPPVPSPRSTPPKPSLMYADVDSDDSDDESSDEDEESTDRKVLEFPARTQGEEDIHRVHRVEVIATESDESDSEDSDAPPPPPSTSPPHDEEIEAHHGKNLIDLSTPRADKTTTRERSGSEKENSGVALNGVTRLSLNSDGKSTLYTGSGIRVQLESNDIITDDEFSEKLI